MNAILAGLCNVHRPLWDEATRYSVSEAVRAVQRKVYQQTNHEVVFRWRKQQYRPNYNSSSHAQCNTHTV